MVANIRTGATVGGAIRYNEEKVNRGQAEVLFWHRRERKTNCVSRFLGSDFGITKNPEIVP